MTQLNLSLTVVWPSAYRHNKVLEIWSKKLSDLRALFLQIPRVVDPHTDLKATFMRCILFEICTRKMPLGTMYQEQVRELGI